MPENRRSSMMPVALLIAVAFAACKPPATDSPPETETPPETAAAATSDPVTLSFAFVGCNRVGWSAAEGHPLPASTANEPQLLQTFKDVEALAPDYLFLVGDIVRNETDGKTLTSQLELWQSLWEGSTLAGTGTTLVPLTGNHEVLKSVEWWSEKDGGDGCDSDFYEVPDASSNSAWLEWLNKPGHTHPPQPDTAISPNGPTPSTDAGDLLLGDNSQLTYSFDASTSDGKKVHFVVIDTDTDSSFSTTDAACYQPPHQDTAACDGNPAAAGTMGQHVPGWIPLDWLRQDLAAAGDSDLVFALGHKPLFFPATAGLDTTSVGRGSIFNCGEKMLARDLFTAFQGTDSFVAYLTSHQHLYDAAQIPDGSNRSVWQIVAGDGGSPLIEGAAPAFGFTLVEIHQSGRVTATPYARPMPDPYYGASGVEPAKPGKSFDLRSPG